MQKKINIMKSCFWLEVTCKFALTSDPWWRRIVLLMQNLICSEPPPEVFYAKRSFHVNFKSFPRTLFPTEHLWWMLLHVYVAFCSHWYVLLLRVDLWFHRVDFKLKVGYSKLPVILSRCKKIQESQELFLF